jgi:hypothetical protein
MTLIPQILSRNEFRERPPVLVDVGASGAIHPKWRAIAPYSVCIAFDADNRQMGYVVREASGFRKLYVYNRIVTDLPVPETDFFLTRSPYCSSVLKPREDKLRQWEFQNLFVVHDTVRLKAVTLPRVLEEVGVKYVDWFKTDSQGTDLRLFKSLGEVVMDRVIVSEFEPGIIDAYEGEDKLWQVMQFMERRPFWMSEINIKGSKRARNDIIAERHSTGFALRKDRIETAPGWGEVTFIHSFDEGIDGFGIREFLLGWVFAVLERQFGFALEIAVQGKERFNDAIFEEMEAYIVQQLFVTEHFGYAARNTVLQFMRRIANKAARILDSL